MTLNTRLLLSYLLIIAVFVCLVGLVLSLLLTNVLRATTFAKLNAAADASIALVLSPRATQLPVEQIAESRHVRILLTNAEGWVLRDSSGGATRWNFWGETNYQGLPPDQQNNLRGTWTDEEGGTWLFVSRRWPPPQDATQRRPGRIVFTAPEPSRRQWFSEFLARPLFIAGGIALVLSALLAWLISRSVARPLRRVADAAHAIALGDYEQALLVSGPTEVRRLAQDFNTMAHQVRASRDAQRDFVTNVSHELKTPLTSIQGYSQAILDGTAADPETVRRSAAIIHDEAGRMARMVSDLLDLARIESGQVVMRREAVDLRLLLENVVERFRLRAEGAGVALKTQLADLPPLMGDGDRLAQVFANLLDNALKHTPQDGQVTVTCESSMPSGVRRQEQARPRTIQVAVSDSGQGIPPEDLPRVFERFYQVDKSRRHTGSIGLGLAIAREIVEAHGGSIEAESIVGLGTRFTVLLPLQA
jgi:two-component system OmpR family sensor kinase